MIYILYHSPCQDGFGAAYAAWKKFKNNAKYIGVNYGKSLPEMPDASEVYILDFSYPKEDLINLSKKCKLVVLDHHKTAQEQLQGLDFAQFDMNRSGAGMAWDYFHPDTPRPWLINHIEDRDLWTFKIPNTQEIATALFSYEPDFELWDSFSKDEILKEGKTLLRYKLLLCDEITRQTQISDFLNYKNIPIVNAPGNLVSDVGEALANKFPDAPFWAIYYDSKDGKRKWSLRSTKDKEDVSKIALQFGGGGHKSASGFIEVFPGEHININPKKT